MRAAVLKQMRGNYMTALSWYRNVPEKRAELLREALVIEFYPASHKSTWQKTADYDQRQKVAAQFKRRNQHTVNRLATNGQ